ncbi:hypothetical protein [Paraburkholderia sp. ZP32-5]|uniref:hypothetical protein n=1 Tax=Paraburkholderia sp. ZP32-5 TaxID=2883245 RepID=UPI001F30BB07|nr:hypothetical protein [Paraburkholderia sp. ZP32-5]
MTKPSERIVVFVTTAQKRAITATAEDLGISVSELMRRAVLSFGATSEQVKAASIVDRLRAPRAPDALNVALQRVARGTRHARAALPAALQAREADDGDTETSGTTEAAVVAQMAGTTAAEDGTERGPKATPETDMKATTVNPPSAATTQPAPLLPAGVAAALAAEQDAEAAATAEAVARLTAARAAEADDSMRQSPPRQEGTPARLRNSLKRRRIDETSDDDESSSDPSTEGGRFA